MLIDEELVEARVYNHTPKKDKVIYQVKVSMPDAGIYIGGITVQPSKHQGKGLWVQLPRYLAGKKWIRPIETSGDSPFFKLIESAARDAVERYTEDHYEPTDEELDNPEAGLDEAIASVNPP